MITKVQLLFDLSNYQTRKSIGQEEFERDFTHVLKRFKIEGEMAFDEMKSRIATIPVNERERRLKAVMLNGLVCGRMMKAFPDICQPRKYGRVSCRINGTEVYFKKLDDRRLPDNVITKNSLAIKKQLQAPNSDERTAIFVGYTTDEKMNNLTGFYAVYIHDNKRIWEIDINSLFNEGGGVIEIKSPVTPIEPIEPALRIAVEKRKSNEAS